MTRICVKNLPKYVSEDRLRDFFSQKGQVTDAKIMRTKDGKSRQFAFIGYHSESEADEAIRFFNNSFLDTHKITCEVAHKVGDPNIPRPWSRYSAKKEGSLTEGNTKTLGGKGLSHSDSKGEGLMNVKEKKSKQNNVKYDPEFQEFLQVMQPRIKSKLWANDTLETPQVDLNGKVGKKETQALNGNKIKSFHESTDEEDEVGLQTPSLQNQSKDTAMKSLHKIARDERISDMDYFKSRVKKDWSDSEDDDYDALNESLNDNECDALDAEEAVSTPFGDQDQGERLSDDHDDEKVDDEKPSSALVNKGEALETNRLFVRNLPYTST